MPKPFTGKKTRMDLTKGPIYSTLLRFSLPIFLGCIVTQLYNVADSVVVGQFVGSDALAAVSASGPVQNIINMFLIGLSSGSNVVIAQRAGAHDDDALQNAVSTVAALTLSAAILITGVGLVLSRPLLNLMQTPENIYADAVSYLTIIFIGAAGNLIYNMGSGALRGMGDSVWPFLFLTFCSLLNLVLDLAAVVWLGLGVRGAAAATALSQFISGAGILWRLNHGGYPVRVRLRTMRFDRHETRQIVAIGLPAAIQNIGNSVAAVCIQSFNNGFGSDFVAGNAIVTKIDDFSYIPTTALSTAVATYVGQNIAALEMDRVKKGINYTIYTLVAVGCAMCGILIALRHVLPYGFTQNVRVAGIAAQGLLVLAFVSTFHGIDRCLVNAMRGAGKSVVPMITAQFGAFSRIPLAYFLAVRTGNYMGIFYALLIASALRTIAIAVYYCFGGWKNAVEQFRERRGIPAEKDENTAE